MVKSLPSNAGGASAIPGWAKKTKHLKKKKNRNSIVNKFKKDLKNAPHQKIFKNKQTPIGTEHSIDVTFLPFPEPVSL